SVVSAGSALASRVGTTEHGGEVLRHHEGHRVEPRGTAQAGASPRAAMTERRDSIHVDRLCALRALVQRLDERHASPAFAPAATRSLCARRRAGPFRSATAASRWYGSPG